jgi:hypothetical protein
LEGSPSAGTSTIAELKGEFALDVVPTRHYGANSAWQQLSVLAHNLIRSFQLDLSWLRYELSKLRAKGLVEKLPHTRRYRLLPQGYRICLVFLKLFERIYAPLTAGLLQPVSCDAALQPRPLSQLDKL